MKKGTFFASIRYQMHYKKTLFLISIVLLILNSVLHYSTPVPMEHLHDIYRRIYYIPIVILSFAGGIRAGILSSFLVTLLYLPHAFLLPHHLMDPESSTEKFMEILLYFAVGSVTGILSDRERKERLLHEKTIRKLESTIQERNRMEERLVRAGKLSAIGQLTSGLAHEIRNPLHSIKGAGEILLDRFLPGEKEHDVLQVLIKEAERLNEILEKFLAFARPLRIDPVPCRVEEEIDFVLSLISKEAGKKGTSIEKDFMEGLPEISADRDRIREVFLNLLLNAIQAMAQGGKMTISSGTCREDGIEKIFISVSDTGKGIPEDVMDEIFNPFFTTKDDGLGLGLSIASRIVEEHGGSINVESRPGRGSTFTIVLPVESPAGKGEGEGR